MLALNEIQSINASMGAQPNIWNAHFSTPSFKGNETSSVSDGDKFEKKDTKKSKNKIFIALAALTGASATGIAVTWAKLGKILKLAGVAIPVAFFARLGKVRELSLRDGLTGLFNKDTLRATLAKDFKKFTKSKGNYSLAMLDMDNFKGFNEILGHEVGDKVLKRIADCMHQIMKKHKINGYRYGGEEFTMLLPNQDSEAAKKVLDEIAEAIKKDEYIQGLLPKFSEKVKGRIAFLSPKLAQFKDIFSKLHSRSTEPEKLSREIISMVEDHIETFDPPHTKALEAFMSKLKAAKGEELRDLLQIRAKIGNESCLGSELDKIYMQYDSLCNDRQKWIKHINRHKMFTVSGGVVNLKDCAISDSDDLIKVADKALKSAKDNGKNSIVIANEELIKKVIERINKAKAAKTASD